jgi:hypothetical protein
LLARSMQHSDLAPGVRLSTIRLRSLRERAIDDSSDNYKY